MIKPPEATSRAVQVRALGLSDPLDAFHPNSTTWKLKDAWDLRVNGHQSRELLGHKAPRVSYTYSVMAVLSAFARGYKAPWVPEIPDKWKHGPMLFVLITPRIKEADLDALQYLRNFNPASSVLPRFQKNGRANPKNGELEWVGGHRLHTIGWKSAGEAAFREFLSVLTCHVIIATEEIPASVMGEINSRLSTTSGKLIHWPTMGLAKMVRLDRNLDTM